MGCVVNDDGENVLFQHIQDSVTVQLLTIASSSNPIMMDTRRNLSRGPLIEKLFCFPEVAHIDFLQQVVGKVMKLVF